MTCRVSADTGAAVEAAVEAAVGGADVDRVCPALEMIESNRIKFVYLIGFI